MMDDKDAFLKSFTPDGSVTADSFLVPHLSHLEELYDYNASLPDSDYYILNASSEYSFDEVYAEKGYTLIDEQYGLRIFRKE